MRAARPSAPESKKVKELGTPETKQQIQLMENK